jgi:5'-3' exonuclease
MGVKGIWPLLKPVGRRTNLNKISNKVLAIDASIWLYQFVKVLPKSGTMSRNYHIVGFFRRICKLLFFNIKPIFIFDGVPPSLKDRTMVNFLT